MKIQVGVFFGGKSVEHEVSVISAAQVAAVMDTEKYALIPVYITKDNEMYTGEGLLDPFNYRDLPALLARCRRTALFRDKGQVHLLRYPPKAFGQPFIARLDLALPVMHGTNGEDGSLQGLFQMHGLPYTGSDVGASAVGMDKWMGKCLLQSAGLPVLPGYCFLSAAYEADMEGLLSTLEKDIAYPMMIKPVNLGSSVGITPARCREDLADAIALAASFSGRILAEPMLTDMREINCAVLGDDTGAQVSACEEPLSTGEILSYQDKYQGGGKPGHLPKGGGPKGMGGALRKLPADLEPEKERDIRALAKRAFHALNCHGVVRVDFLIDKRDEKVYVNELNTIPGSLSFYLWEAAGKPFRDLTEEMIQLAFKRKRVQDSLIWSNELNILADIPKGLGAKRR